MDFFYKIFERIFDWFSGIGLEVFTGSYLVLQFVIFSFLILIYIMTTYLPELKAMRRVGHQLSQLSDQNDDKNRKINEIFSEVKGNSRFKNQWNQYFQRITEKQEDEKIRTEPYFGKEALYDTVGRRQLLDIGGNVHVSLGVLGTFLGLSMGLSGLSLADTEALSGGILTLLGSMKVAFYTSVLGVFLSLLWTGLDRLLYRTIEFEIERQANELDYQLNTDDEEVFLNRIEKISQQQADTLKTILTDALEQVMQPLVSTIAHGNETIHYNFGQMKESFHEMTENIERQASIADEHLSLFKSQSTDVSEKLVQEISEGTKGTIDGFIAMMEASQSNQAMMMDNVQKLTTDLSQAAEQNVLISEKVGGMLTSFDSMTNEVKGVQESYGNSFTQIQSLSEMLKDLQATQSAQMPIQEALAKNNQKFIENSGEVMQGFIQFKKDIQVMHEGIVEELVSKAYEVSTKFEGLASALVDSSKNQQASIQQSTNLIDMVQSSAKEFIPISELLNNSATQLTQFKKDLSIMQNLQNQLLPQLTELNTETAGRMENVMSGTEKHLEFMKSHLETSQAQWESMSTDFEKTRAALNESMKEFSLNIETSIRKTFTTFDDELVKIVSHLHSMTEGVSENLEELSDALEQVAAHKQKAGSLN